MASNIQSPGQDTTPAGATTERHLGLTDAGCAGRVTSREAPADSAGAEDTAEATIPRASKMTFVACATMAFASSLVSARRASMMTETPGALPRSREAPGNAAESTTSRPPRPMPTDGVEVVSVIAASVIHPATAL